MIEAHRLTYIEENPGVTSVQLTKMWNRSKGAISQQIKKLVEKGFVRREKHGGNTKTIYLYSTQKGMELSLAHKMYDLTEITQTVQQLLKTCTVDELITFYKVVSAYNDIL